MRAAQDQFGNIGDRASPCWLPRVVVATMAVPKPYSALGLVLQGSNGVHLEPDNAWILFGVDSVLEVHLILTVVDARWMERNLEGDSRVGIGPITEVLTVLLTGFDDIWIVSSRDGPHIDRIFAAVRDEGIGLSKRCEGCNSGKSQTETMGHGHVEQDVLTMELSVKEEWMKVLMSG